MGGWLVGEIGLVVAQCRGTCLCVVHVDMVHNTYFTLYPYMRVIGMVCVVYHPYLFTYLFITVIIIIIIVILIYNYI